MNRAETPTLFITMRFLLVLVLSIVLIFLDVRMKLLTDFRYYIETALYPVLIFAEAPQTVAEGVSSQFKTRAELIEENERLSNENYLQRVDIMRMQTLEQENAVMRRLLNSPVQSSSRRMFAEVISVDSDPYLQRLVVNRGTSSGVYEGMPVLTDEGLVGQVVSVAYASSRVLLFSDPSSAIPVVNTRNQVRSIVSGTGMHDELIIDNMPRSTDIKEGDLLVTSGLGGIYPEGYPVAIVSSVGFSDDHPFAQVKARPVVDSDKIRYVLMYFYETSQNKDTEEVKPKEQTDSKRMLRQERIRRLIDSLTDVDRTTGWRPAEKKKDDGNQLGLSVLRSYQSPGCEGGADAPGLTAPWQADPVPGLTAPWRADTVPGITAPWQADPVPGLTATWHADPFSGSVSMARQDPGSNAHGINAQGQAGGLYSGLMRFAGKNSPVLWSHMFRADSSTAMIDISLGLSGAVEVGSGR